MPILRSWRSGVHLTIVGRYPPESIRALASANVSVTGYVPQVAPFFVLHRPQKKLSLLLAHLPVLLRFGLRHLRYGLLLTVGVKGHVRLPFLRLD